MSLQKAQLRYVQVIENAAKCWLLKYSHVAVLYVLAWLPVVFRVSF